MGERRLPYADVVNEWDTRALDRGEDFPFRLEKVWEILERNADCDGATVAFTHPQFAERYTLDYPIYLLTLYSAAEELLLH